jgi:hypothetical protein
MPKQKDLKRVVRTRMQKTGESYTTARLYLVRSKPPEADYAGLAGMSDDAVKDKTGRNWREWVALLDAAKCNEQKHRDIARHVASLGTPSWWSQMVTVGYERIRGLRVKGQRCDGDFEASKSRTFAVPVATLYNAFTSARLRARWLREKVNVRSATANKRLRITMPDDTLVEVGFLVKGENKTAVAIQHSKLPDKATADRLKLWWAERLDALREILA